MDEAFELWTASVSVLRRFPNTLDVSIAVFMIANFDFD
jgi:hypothetical protein